MNNPDFNNLYVPVIGISRFRFGTDGEGITTLVAFQGCSLRCTYCLNKESWETEDKFPHYTPEQLYEKLKVDDLYFRATGGGVTFGGGEPCLRADFIIRFREICGNDWKIRLETSLNVDQSLVEKLAPVVDEWIIDTKAERSVAYKEYTGVYRQRFKNNFYYLIDKKKGYGIPKEKITLKVPIIPGFVTEEQAKETADIFRKYHEGCKIELIRYLDNEELANKGQKSRARDGKRICKVLKALRSDIAKRYSIELEERDCTHTGNCPGTCPRCETDIAKLERGLLEKLENKIEISEEIIGMIDQNKDNTKNRKDDEHILQGDVILPPRLPDNIQGDIQEFPDEPLDGQIIEGEFPPQIPNYYQYKKIFFKECGVAGISFHIEAEDEIWNELEEGTELALVRDKNNKHDKNAIAVALADDYNGSPDDFDFELILGYIPRNENSDLATMLDAGYGNKFSAEITTLRRYGNVNNRIRITIYIESNEPQLVRPNYFRAHTLTPVSIRNMNRELKEYGVAYFRFGGFPSFNLIFPTVGEKIVLIYPDGDDIVLYLTRIMAEGEDCGKYGERWGDQYCDDQIGYVVSVISGPIITGVNELKVLQELNLFNLNGIDYLSKNETDDFRRFFDRVLFKIINKGNIDMDPSIDDPELRKEIEEDERRDN